MSTRKSLSGLNEEPIGPAVELRSSTENDRRQIYGLLKTELGHPKI